MTHSDKPRTPEVQDDALTILSATFPAIRDCLPLAVGIHKAIREKLPSMDKEHLRSAMKRHTASTRYLKALTQGEVRFDLEGTPAGSVTPEQKQQAREALRERFKKIADRKKAEQQAQQMQENLLKLAEKFNVR